jgi:ABC-2 type transport system ATP-binding protein
MKNSVEISHLEKSFSLSKGRFFKRVREQLRAVDDISLSVPTGQSVAFIGPNGAGKSTTIKMLTGILKPSGGQVSVLGLTPWLDRENLSRKIGVVFGQRSQLWYHLPPSDSFELLSRIYDLDRKRYIARRDFLIDKFKIESFLTTQVRRLSLGQRMRAEIAASLLHEPEILFLDEPTIGLDVVARQELRDLIRSWNRENGLTIFLTSHDAGDIESVAERVVVVNHGRIVLDNSVTCLRRDYLRSKLVRVVFHDVPRPFDHDGVRVLEWSDHKALLEVNLDRASIQTIIDLVLVAGSVADITIEDPPLEEVIAHIYSAPKEADLKEVS